MNAYEVYMDYLFGKAGRQRIPLSGTFELTSRCNLDCKMCYIHKHQNDAAALKQELPAEFWIDLAQQCKSQGMLHLLLTGGEPMLRSDFEYIYTQCRKMGLLVSVNSNSTLLSDRILNLFCKYPPARVNITIYGASPDTYNSLCGNPSAYEKTICSILALKNAGILVKINCSTTSWNLQDVKQIYDFARENGLPIQNATYMYPPVRACENGSVSTLRLTAEESARAQLEYDKYRFPREELHSRWRKQLAGVRVLDEEAHCQEVPMEKVNCRAGYTTFWVTWNGQLRPCGMMTFPSVDIRKRGFENAWNDIRALRDEINVPRKCSYCELKNICDQCAAVCQAETSSFTDVPVYMCDRTKEYISLIKNELKSD